ncbi:unnamed protein product [Peniophora sp. CBMAI 1063]|nr:unnamed protein product [Peniophora sp. CBMAI 1063]
MDEDEPISWHALVPQPPTNAVVQQVVTWTTREEINSATEGSFVLWLTNLEQLATADRSSEWMGSDSIWALASPLRVPLPAGTPNWTSSDEARFGTWVVCGRREPFPPCDPGPPPFANRTNTFARRTTYPGSSAGSVWPPPVWYRRATMWTAWLATRPEGSSALLWRYERDDRLIEEVPGGYVLSSVAELGFNSIADDVEAMSLAVHRALHIVPPPPPVPRYHASPELVFRLEDLVAYMDDMRWAALNHLAYLRMHLGAASLNAIRGFAPPGWSYPSAPGMPFWVAHDAYHVRGGTHVGTLIDTRALPEDWPSLNMLAQSRVPFWWLQGREETLHEREGALRYRNFQNENLPRISACRAAVADTRRRRELRQSTGPYGAVTRAILMLDRGQTLSLFLERIQSEDQVVREDVAQMSMTPVPVSRAARNLWIRRYEYVRGYPRPGDITFLSWRPLLSREDVLSGREAHTSSWGRRLRVPAAGGSDGEDLYSDDSDYDSDKADGMLFSDTRTWPPAPMPVFPVRPARPPARLQFAQRFSAAPAERELAFAPREQTMDLDTPSQSEVPPRPQSPSAQPVSPIPTPPARHRPQPTPRRGIVISDASTGKGKGKRRADADADTVDGFSVRDLQAAQGASSQGGPYTMPSAGESSSVTLDQTGQAGGSSLLAPLGSQPAGRKRRRGAQHRDVPLEGRFEGGAPSTTAETSAASSNPSSTTPARQGLASGPWPAQPPRRPLDLDSRWPQLQVRWPGALVSTASEDLSREMRSISPSRDTRVVHDAPAPVQRGRLLLPPASALRLWWWMEQHPYALAPAFVPWALARGVRFLWGAPGSALPRLPDPLGGGMPRATLPWYEWVHDVVEVLRRPNARAFLWDGGILWRLALEFRSDLLAEAGSGPSASASLLPAPWPGSFVSDTLSSAEVNLVIGRRADGLSWWPHPDTWDAGLSIGEWWTVHEDWFSVRLQAIIAGDAVPLADTAWYGHIREWITSASRPVFHAGNLRRVSLLTTLLDNDWQEALADGFVRLTLDDGNGSDMDEDGQ